MLRWKVNVLSELKSAGYNQDYMLKNNLLSGNSVTILRKLDTNISLKTLNKICNLLHCQPGNLLEWVEESEE